MTRKAKINTGDGPFGIAPDLATRQRLLELQVGEQLDLDKRLRAAAQFLYVMDEELDWRRRFRIREWSPGVTRVWRLE